MAGLDERDKWEDEVYQIEENDPVQGGKNGITNKPTQQLANRTLWLKKVFEALTKKATPKTLTANTTNNVDADGHTHEIAKGSTSQVGLIRLTNDTGLDSETLGLSAKAGKNLAQQIAQNQLSVNTALNTKADKSAISDAVNVDSSTTIGSSKAVKTAYDKAVDGVNKANNAQNTANDGVSRANQAQTKANVANDNANTRVSKSGDTMTGDLAIKSGQWSAIKCFNSDNYYLRVEVAPNSEPNFGTLIYHDGTNILHRLLLPKKTGTFALMDDLKWGNLMGIPSASTSLKGIVQLSSATDSGSADKAATSLAVKTAYDKAVDGVSRANQAQSKANQADDNANGRVSKNGDEIKWLTVTSDRAWLTINSRTADSAGLDFIIRNTANAQVSLQAVDIGNYSDELRVLTTPKGENYNTDRRRHTFTFNPEGQIWSLGYGWLHDYFGKKTDVTLAQNTANSAMENANGRVSKNGDEIKWLNVKRDHAWATINSLTADNASVDFMIRNTNHSQVSLQAVDIGNFSDELRVLTTPRGENYNTDRRRHTFTFNPEGNIWSLAYGWLHDYFAKQSDNNNIWRELNNTFRKNRFVSTFYQHHYNGAEVYKIPLYDGGGLMITVMNVVIHGSQEVNLPEAYSGWATPLAVDVGAGRHTVGISMLGNNKVKIENRDETGLQIVVLGTARF